MQVKCEYCGEWMDDHNKNCPHCGAINENFERTASGTPQTIEELKKWYEDQRLPPEETTRFFIGKDVKSPRAFGIYEASSGEFVVYKNKNTGERTERYRGTDEAYAVNELFLKLKSEILNQKIHNTPQKRPNINDPRPASDTRSEHYISTPTNTAPGNNYNLIVVLMALMIIIICNVVNAGKVGYYKIPKEKIKDSYSSTSSDYNNYESDNNWDSDNNYSLDDDYTFDNYYKDLVGWYRYDYQTDSWESTNSPKVDADIYEFKDDNFEDDWEYSPIPRGYSESSSDDSSSGWSNFWSSDSDSSSSWDSNDYSWSSSSDSWSSSDTDWDSDW